MVPPSFRRGGEGFGGKEKGGERAVGRVRRDSVRHLPDAGGGDEKRKKDRERPPLLPAGGKGQQGRGKKGVVRASPPSSR